MVAPLFLISLFMDKAGFVKKFNGVLQKPIGYSLGRKKFSITISEAISGTTFLAMGGLIVYLSATNRLFAHSEYQVNINIFLTKILNSASGFIEVVPEYIWAILLIVAVAFIVKLAINQFSAESGFVSDGKKEKYEK